MRLEALFCLVLDTISFACDGCDGKNTTFTNKYIWFEPNVFLYENYIFKCHIRHTNN